MVICGKSTITGLALTALVGSLMTAPALPAHAAEIIGGSALGSGIVVNSAPGIGALPATEAESYLIADLDTGEILAAKNPHKKLPPASTIKTLTALALLPRLDKSAKYIGQLSDTKVDGSKAGIYPGRAYSIDSLWHALFLLSANDSGMALAHAAGGLTKTLTYMQSEAKRVQALDTVARSPHGLDRPGQVSSAYDLALINREALKREDFRRYAATTKYTFLGSGKGNKPLPIYNQNKLLTSYSGAIGVKTGYTTQGKNTYVGAATRNGHTIIITMMYLPYGRDALAVKLLNWGFKARGKVTPIGVLVEPLEGAANLTPKVPANAKLAKAEKVVTQSSGISPSGLPIKLILIPILLVVLLRLRVRIKMWKRARYRRMNPTAS